MVRLDLLCAAYGEVSPEAVVEATPSRLRELADFSDGRAAVISELSEHAACYRDDAEWIELNAEQFIVLKR